jgi:hypothetical protein
LNAQLRAECPRPSRAAHSRDATERRAPFGVAGQCHHAVFVAHAQAWRDVERAPAVANRAGCSPPSRAPWPTVRGVLVPPAGRAATSRRRPPIRVTRLVAVVRGRSPPQRYSRRALPLECAEPNSLALLPRQGIARFEGVLAAAAAKRGIPSGQAQMLCWVGFITLVPSERFDCIAIAELYGLRRQIELQFKRDKVSRRVSTDSQPPHGRTSRPCSLGSSLRTLSASPLSRPPGGLPRRPRGVP